MISTGTSVLPFQKSTESITSTSLCHRRTTGRGHVYNRFRFNTSSRHNAPPSPDIKDERSRRSSLRTSPSADMFNSHYRLWLLRTIASSVLLPVATTIVALRLLQRVSPSTVLGGFVKTLACAFSPVVWWTLQEWLSGLEGEMLVKQEGCKQVPLLKGKLWGSLDLAPRLVTASSCPKHTLIDALPAL